MNPLPIISLPKSRVAPRDFLRQLLIGENLTEVEYLNTELERGYKTQCGKVLSILLGVGLHTIRCRWGKALDFEEMPQQNQLVLGYITHARINTQYANQIRSGAYTPESLSAQKFLEYALALDSLSSEEIKTRLSKNGFFYECARVLSTATGIKYDTVVCWGNDIRFNKMPSEHGRTLYYAQTAMKVLINQTTQQLIAA